MKRLKTKYADVRCLNCGAIFTVSWVSPKEDGWKTCRCWNCDEYLSRVELEIFGVPSFWMVETPSELQIRQALYVEQR